MADLFDALAARALGTAPALAPLLAPRFATPVDEPEPAAAIAPDEAVTAVDELASVAASPSEPETRPDQQLQRRNQPTASPAARPDQQPRRRDQPTAPPAALVPSSDQPPRPAAAAVPATASEPTEQAVLVEWPKPRAPAAEAAAVPARARLGQATEPLRERIPMPPIAVDREQGRDPSAEAPRPMLETPAREPITGVLPGHQVDPPAHQEAVSARSSLASETPTAGTQVTVSIGYVEVRAPSKPTAPAQPQQPRWPQPRISLQDYLRRDGQR